MLPVLGKSTYFLTIDHVVHCRVFVDVLISLRAFPSIPILLRVKWVRNGFYQMFFLHHYVNFSFSLLIWWITLLVGQMLSQSCRPGMNPPGLIYNLLYTAGLDLLVFCEGYLHQCLWEVLVCGFPVLQCLCLLWVLGWCWSHKSEQCSLCFISGTYCRKLSSFLPQILGTICLCIHQSLVFTVLEGY